MMKAGLQACSLADPFVIDPKTVIEKLRGCGYKYIESAGNMFDSRLTTPAKEVRKMMDDAGLEHAAKHHNPQTLVTIGAEIDLMHDLGGKYMILATDFYPNMDELLRKAEHFNELGKIAKQNGLVYMMHNHCHELQHFGDKTILEWIAENTDPEYFSFEIDIMWSYRGGVAPWDIVEKLGKRVKLLHIDDFCKQHGSFWEEVPEETPITGKIFGEKNIDTGADIGQGKLDIQRAIDAANRYADISYGFIELSSNTLFPGETYQSAAYGLEQLKKYSGIDCDPE